MNFFRSKARDGAKPFCYAPSGRRSTDLLHLLLQNLYFMCYCRNYRGTSAVMAVALLQPLLVGRKREEQQEQRQKQEEEEERQEEEEQQEREEGKQLVGRLVGTHAHEMSSMVQQLMVEWDRKAGRGAGMEVRGRRAWWVKGWRDLGFWTGKYKQEECLVCYASSCNGSSRWALVTLTLY